MKQTTTNQNAEDLRPMPNDFITGDDRDDEYAFNAYLAAVISWMERQKQTS